MSWRSITIALLGLGILGAPAFGANPGRPGSVNYVEGAAFLEGRPLNAQDVGTIDLDAGQVLSTAAGKVEILLTPGVFLRLDSNSSIKMISPELTLTQVELVSGRASVEVDEIHDQNNIQIVDAGVATRLEKTGYYEFNANTPTARVFQGKAEVEVGETKTATIKNHHELALVGLANQQPGAKVKPADFDARAGQDELYNWSSLRSQYLAEANNQIAGEYGYGGYNPGWYWDPYGWDYTFIGAGPYWSPFGFGFYPFGWGGYYGFYGRGYYGHGYYGHGGYGHGGYYGHGGGYAGGGGGFHGGAGGGGGFHGGGGGGGHR